MDNLKTIRIFISSTFKDMDVERDALRNIVAPRLNQELTAYGINVEMVDLRHTVETNPSLSQIEREQRIFKICLDEIESCSPYFIALIGHRYGWIPDISKMGIHEITENLMRNDFPLNTNEISVTSYEFLKGLFERGNKNKHCLVYVRSSKSYDTLSNNDKEIYMDSKKDDQRRNSELREYLINNFISNSNKDTYILDPTGSNKNQLNQWCDRVYSDIKDLLKEEINKATKNTPQQTAHLFFIQNHLKIFMGREDEITKCLENIRNYGVCNILSTKEGVGRSSLLCKLYEILSADNANRCIFVSNQAVVGTDFEKELAYICEQMCLYLEIPNNDRTSLLERDNKFSTLRKLKELAQKKGIVFYILWDNFNQALETLNYETTECMRPIVTTTKITTNGYNNICENEFLHYVYIDEFNEKDVRQILLGKRKSFTESILKKEKSRNPQWLSLATSIYLNLNKADYLKIRSANNPDQEQNIDTYIVDMVEQMPDKVSELSYFWLKKLFTIFGENFCNDYLGALSLIETGLKDKDVSRIINQPEDWCIYFRQMAGKQVIEKTEKGTWKLAEESRIPLLKSFPPSHLDIIAHKAYNYAQKTPLPHLTRANYFILSLLGKDILVCQKYLDLTGHAASDWFRGVTPSDLANKDIALWLDAKSPYIEKCLEQLVRGANLSYDFVSGIDNILSLAAQNGHQKEYLKITSIILDELQKKEIGGIIEGEHYLIQSYIYSKRADIFIEIKDNQESDKQAELGLLLCKKYIENTNNWRNIYFDLIQRKIDNASEPDKKMACIKEYFIPICLGKSISPSVKDIKSVMSFCIISSLASILYQNEGNADVALDLLKKAIIICKDSIEDVNKDTSFYSYWQGQKLKEILMDLIWYLCKLHIETTCCPYNMVIKEVEFAIKLTEEYKYNVIENPSLHVKNYAIRFMYAILLGKSSKAQAVKVIRDGMIPLIQINDPYCMIAPADEDANYDISVAWMLCARLFLMNIYNEDEVDDIPDFEALHPTDFVQMCDNIWGNHSQHHTNELMLDINYIYMYVLYLFLKIEEKKGFIHSENCSDCLKYFILLSKECRLVSMRFKYMEEDIKTIEAKINASYSSDDNDVSEVFNNHENIKSIITQALDNGNIDSAEKESEKYLKGVLNKLNPDSNSLGMAYFFSGIVQLHKKVWFKAYDKFEKSIKAYEHDGTTVAPVCVYEKLAETYIKSQNDKEAETVLKDAINKYQRVGIPENKYHSLCDLLKSIGGEKEEKAVIEEKINPVENTNHRSIWDKIMALFYNT